MMREGYQRAWVWTNFARFCSKRSPPLSLCFPLPQAQRDTLLARHLFDSDRFPYMRFLALKAFCVSVVGRAVRGSSGQGWRG